MQQDLQNNAKPTQQQSQEQSIPNQNVVGKISPEGNNSENQELMDEKKWLDTELMKLGVSQRKLQEHNKRRFKYNITNGSGYFEVPARTSAGTIITKDQVVGLATNFQKKFKASCEIDFQGDIYTVKFSPFKQEVSDNDATSWDANSVNSNGGNEQRKSAQTIEEMLKVSRENWANGLKKTGNK